MRTTASLLLHVGAAAVLALLINGRCDVNAQATQKDCYQGCENMWLNLTRESYPLRPFLARFGNSSSSAADYYCNTASNVSGCFDKCKTAYSSSKPSDSSYVNGVLRAVQLCTTDNGKCRAIESQLWCGAYSPNLCGATLQSNDQCIRSVQTQKGCDISNPVTQSQKAVLSLILDSRLYCLNDLDVSQIDPTKQDSVQTCDIYVPVTCLAKLKDSSTGTYSPYYSSSFHCSEINSAKDCLSATLTQTIQYNNISYSMPCKSHPKGSELFTDMSNVLTNFVYTPCTSSASYTSSMCISTLALLPYMAVLLVKKEISS